MTAEMEARITQCKATLETRREQAEAAVQAFLDVVATRLTAWIPEGVKGIVTREHETTAKLGPEKVAALKADLAKLTPEVPALVRTWFGGKDLWAHRVDYDPGRDTNTRCYNAHQDSNSGPMHMHAPLERSMRDHMGKFMARHGFASKNYDGSLYFPVFRWDPSFTAPMNRYAHAYEEFVKAQRELDAAIRTKGEHDAASLWDKA
jgi:hypothetical protein